MKDKNLSETIKSVLSNGRSFKVLKKEVSHTLIINFTIDSVIKEWDNKFNRNDLFKRHIRGEIVLARNVAIVVVNKLTLLSPKDLFNYMPNGIGTKSIRRTILEYRKLDMKNKFDKTIIDRTEKILEIVVSGMNKIKNK
jgi:hypothetical protein